MSSLAVPPTSLHPARSVSLHASTLLLDDAAMRSAVRDLHRANPAIYWTDLLLTALVGWAAFAGAVRLPAFSAGALLLLLLASVAQYRALCFMHEITHQSGRTLPGFETAWNALAGFPLLMPSFIYVGVHQDHHRISSYGTEDDPEYLPFAHSALRTVAFTVESAFIPLVLLLRFLVLGPLGLLAPPVHQWLVRCGSALTMNLRYRRTATAALLHKVRRDTALLLLLWAGAVTLAVMGVLPWRAFPLWLAMDAIISVANTLRTLGSHAYENEGEALDRTGQLLDSIDTPGSFWTELWAPVGLRYHALHHYFPGIPYHNLPQAYRRLTQAESTTGDYHRMTSPSLPWSLRELVRKGLGHWESRRLQPPGENSRLRRPGPSE